MEYIATGLILASIVVNVVFLLVIATAYMRPEQTGLTPDNDLYYMVFHTLILIVFDLAVLWAQPGRIPLGIFVIIFALFTVMHIILIAQLVSEFKYGRKRIGL